MHNLVRLAGLGWGGEQAVDEVQRVQRWAIGGLGWIRGERMALGGAA